MGCFVCNLLEIHGRNIPYDTCKKCAKVEETDIDEVMVTELKEELCNDIAVYHFEMVKRIIEILRLERPERYSELCAEFGSIQFIYQSIPASTTIEYPKKDANT